MDRVTLRRWLSRGSFAVVVCALGHWLQGCGTPICVAGIGNCDVFTKAAPNATPTPTTGFSVSAAPTTVTMSGNQTSLITVTGGLSPFSYNVTNGPGNGNLANNGSQATFTPTATGQCTVTVTDSTSPVQQRQTVTITVQ